MRIATWNVNSLRLRLPQLEKWAKKARPDVLCLQETKTEDAEFPAAELRALGFEHIAFRGERSYNGVAILSRFPLDDLRFNFGDGVDDSQPRMVTARVAGIRVIGCYVPNGQDLASPKFAYKLAWLERLRAFLDRIATPDQPLALVGDMNVALGDSDVWDPFACAGTVLFHPLEHERMAPILAFGLVDTYREKHPFGSQFSWWDYRAMGFQRNHGLRIDHIFVTPPLMARLQTITIDREIRGWPSPSDHVPVVATFSDMSG